MKKVIRFNWFGSMVSSCSNDQSDQLMELNSLCQTYVSIYPRNNLPLSMGNYTAPFLLSFATLMLLFFLMYNDYVHCRKNGEKKQNRKTFPDIILEYLFFRSNNPLPQHGKCYIGLCLFFPNKKEISWLNYRIIQDCKGHLILCFAEKGKHGKGRGLDLLSLWVFSLG